MSLDANDFEMKEEIGSGQFGKVFKADYLGTIVAVKQCFKIEGMDFKKYLEREVSLLQTLRHPNIIQFLGIYTDLESTFIVTEFLSGGNLSSYIKDNPAADWHTRISFSIDASRAIYYLHKQNIIHRDLKPENLLLTENLRIKVCDFGLSRILPKTPEDIKRLSYCGTDFYMSPEIMLCMEFDSKSDIFSYGIIAAELLAWKISDGASFMRRLIPGFGFDEKEIRKYDTVITPPPYVDMILKCLEIDTRKRITMKEVQFTLKEIELILAATHGKNMGTIFIAKTNLDSMEDSPFALDVPSEASRGLKSKQNSALFSDIDEDEQKSNPSLHRLNKASVISHNIPHRFSIHRSASLVKKCELCEKHVYFKHLICDECDCVAHLECGVKLPSYCGLTKSLQTLVSPHKKLQSAESLLSPPSPTRP